MPFLRVTSGGMLTLVNSDRVVKIDTYTVEAGFNSILTFLPGASPAQLAIDQTVAQFSAALGPAVSVGGA